MNLGTKLFNFNLLNPTPVAHVQPQHNLKEKMKEKS